MSKTEGQVSVPEVQIAGIKSDLIERINTTLTNVPVDLYRSWKAMAALSDLTMRDALLEALQLWVAAKTKEMEERIKNASVSG